MSHEAIIGFRRTFTQKITGNYELSSWILFYYIVFRHVFIEHYYEYDIIIIKKFCHKQKNFGMEVFLDNFLLSLLEQ